MHGSIHIVIKPFGGIMGCETHSRKRPSTPYSTTTRRLKKGHNDFVKGERGANVVA